MWKPLSVDREPEASAVGGGGGDGCPRLSPRSRARWASTGVLNLRPPFCGAPHRPKTLQRLLWAGISHPMMIIHKTPSQKWKNQKANTAESAPWGGVTDGIWQAVTNGFSGLESHCSLPREV